MEAAKIPNAIQPCLPSEYGAITELWEASVRATHDFLKEEDILFFKPLILNEYLAAVKLFCKKDANQQITGFLGTSEEKIEMLFIHPLFRGKGIGKELLEYAIKVLGIRKVDVNEQNEQAVGFYKRFGFKVIGRTQVDSIGKPYPVLQMELA